MHFCLSGMSLVIENQWPRSSIAPGKNEKKKKINEIPKYKFLNIKVLGNSSKVPTFAFPLLTHEALRH